MIELSHVCQNIAMTLIVMYFNYSLVSSYVLAYEYKGELCFINC